MGIIIQKRRHYLTRFILWSVIILLLGFSPTIVGVIGALISEFMTGVPCHESNCKWLTLGWLTIITWPVSFFIVFVLFVIVILDTVRLRRSNRNSSSISE